MKKDSKVSMPKKEFVKEHKRLVQVLRSPSHKDDKVEAKDQAKELAEVTSKSKEDVGTRAPSDKKLADKVVSHNQKKLHSFAKKMKKSLDFKDTLVSIDAKDQLLAEQTVNPKLLDYVQKNMSNASTANPQASQWSIPFPTGILTLSQREAGIYNGHFSDRDGQIVEKFDAQTVAIIAKTLQIKSLVPDMMASEGAVAVPQVPEAVATQPAAADIAMSAHNRIDDLQRQLIEAQRGKSIRVRYGDFEVEIKKSVRDFVNDFKAGRPVEKDSIRKAISSWKKYVGIASDTAAARELMENWETHQNSFCQFVDALARGDDE